MNLMEHFSAFFTIASFVAFIGIVAWAYGRRAQVGFDAAARLPFDEPTLQPCVLRDRRGDAVERATPAAARGR